MIVVTFREFNLKFKKSLNKKLSYRRETALPGGGLEATYAVHLRLIGKPVMDFLLVITELFFARCNG